MPATYDCLATTTVSGTSTTSVQFSSIPGTYTDLVIALTSYWSNQDAVGVTFNGDTGSNYSVTQLISTATTSLGSDRQTNRVNIFPGRLGTNTFASGFTASPLSFGTALLNINNYSNTTTNKTLLSRVANYSRPAYGNGSCLGLWRSTAAITSVNITADGTSYILAGSMFTLYGIKAA